MTTVTNKREKAEARVDFRIHLYTFMAVMALLIIINFLTSPGYLWFKWPLLGWGIGLAAHGVYANIFAGGPDMRERMIEKEMDRLDL